MGGALTIKSTRKGGSNPLLDVPSSEMQNMNRVDAAKRPAWMNHPNPVGAGLLPKRPPTRRVAP